MYEYKIINTKEEDDKKNSNHPIWKNDIEGNSNANA